MSSRKPPVFPPSEKALARRITTPLQKPELFNLNQICRYCRANHKRTIEILQAKPGGTLCQRLQERLDNLSQALRDAVHASIANAI